MERLTRRINGVVVYVGAKNPYSTGQIPCEVEPAGVREMMDRLAAYEDTGWTPEMLHKLGENAGHMWDFAQAAENMTVGRLKELAEADKDGRVVVLPCRQGDELWTYCNHPVKRVYSFTVSDVSTLNGRTVLNTLGLGTIRPEDIGKTVFLTREEAERAMEGKKDGNETNM